MRAWAVNPPNASRSNDSFPMQLFFDRSALNVRGKRGFTLIELLAVMAIILVLAGLILNIAGSAAYNSAKSRATAEIKAIETALESYKSDNGAYPSDSTNVNNGSGPTTQVLDPQKDFDPAKYVNSSEFLFQALTGQQPGASTVTKSYISFTVQQLHVAPNATGNTTTATPNSPYMYIVDPFGFSYGYSTLYATNAQTPAATPAATPTGGYNPTFDLWSTAGYATGGKKTPNNLQGANDAAKYSNIWVKNW